jgi:aryl-alcohol dehydrogenase-like predicted oxidoreductase
MERRPLGDSGLEVSVLSFGAMTFSPERQAIARVDEAAAHRMVHRVLDAGVNLIDTADAYDAGRSEEILGRAIKGRRDEVVIATKCGFGENRGPGGLAYDRVIAACDASLRRLGVDVIDLYQLHRADRATPIEETLRALDDLVAAGKVRAVGNSNFRAWETAGAVARQRALGRPEFCSAQVYYSLVGRDVEHEILPQCRADGVGVLVYSPLAGGYLSGKYRGSTEVADGGEGRRTGFEFPPIDLEQGERIVAVLRDVAAAHSRDGATAVTPAQVALAWTMPRPGVTSVLFGANTPEQLEQNLAAAQLVLTDDDTARLDTASAIPEVYPEWWDPAMRVEPPL